MVGVITNVITSVEITEGNANDAPYVPTLVSTTATRLNVSEVSADKGYISNRNLEAVNSVGASPYIPFKTNATGSGFSLWYSLFHYYNFKRQEFLAHYHRRSNVESTFSMLKAKFGGYVRSKTFPVQVNEVLYKVIAHNLCVLVSSIYELGIEPVFRQKVRLHKKSSRNEVSRAKPAQPQVAIILYVIAFRWAINDQRRRCPVCLRLLRPSASIGSFSHSFLDWYGIELFCSKGHGLLHVPEIATTYDTQRWTDLDPSWSVLFVPR